MSRWLYYGSYCTPHSFESSNVSAQWRMGRSSSSMPWQAFSAFCLRFLLKLEGFSYDLEMKTREQNRNNKRSKVERFGWFIERIKTRLAFCWFNKRTLGSEKPHARELLEINRYFALTSYCNPIG